MVPQSDALHRSRYEGEAENRKCPSWSSPGASVLHARCSSTSTSDRDRGGMGMGMSIPTGRSSMEGAVMVDGMNHRWTVTDAMSLVVNHCSLRKSPSSHRECHRRASGISGTFTFARVLPSIPRIPKLPEIPEACIPGSTARPTGSR